MSKIDLMMLQLLCALEQVEKTKAVMMDSNTNSIFWNKMDTIEADLQATLNLLEETRHDSE